MEQLFFLFALIIWVTRFNESLELDKQIADLNVDIIRLEIELMDYERLQNEINQRQEEINRGK